MRWSSGFTWRRLTRTKRDRAYPRRPIISIMAPIPLRYRAFSTYGIRATSSGNSPFFLSFSLSLLSRESLGRNLFALLRHLRGKTYLYPPSPPSSLRFQTTNHSIFSKNQFRVRMFALVQRRWNTPRGGNEARREDWGISNIGGTCA